MCIKETYKAFYITISDSVQAEISVKSGLYALQEDLESHASDGDIHFSSEEREKLENIEYGAQKNVQPDWNNLKNRPDSLPASDVYDWAKEATKPSYTANEVGADQSGTANEAVSGHNMSNTAHEDIRQLISGLATRLNTLADSDDTTLDQMSEIVTYIKSNKSLIDTITTSKVSVSDVVDNLTSTDTKKPLSAAQGRALANGSARDSTKYVKPSGGIPKSDLAEAVQKYIGTEIVQTLSAGSTAVTFTNSAITTSSTIDIYVNV